MNTLTVIFSLILVSFYTPPLFGQSSDFKQDSISLFTIFGQIDQQRTIDLDLLGQAQAITEKHVRLQDQYNYLYAKTLIIKAQLVPADSFIDLSLKAYNDFDTINQGIARLYNLKGSIAIYRGKQEEGMSYMMRSLRIYEKLNALKEAGAIRSNLTNIFISRKEYSKAYTHVLKGIEQLRASNDSLYLPMVLGMAAISAAELEKWDEVKKYADEGLALSEKTKNSRGIVASNYALGEWLFHHKAYGQSLNLTRKALDLAEKIKDYTLILACKASLVKTNLDVKAYQKAIKEGEQALDLAKKINNQDIQYSLYKNMAKANHGIGNEATAFSQMEKAEELYRGKVNANNQSIINELEIKYDTEKKNNTILRQEKDIAEQRNWLFITGGVALLAILGGIFIKRDANQQRKIAIQKNQLDKAEAYSLGEEQERNRIAGDLHDGVASNLVALKMMLSNEHEEVQNLLNDTHKEVRAISHQLAPVDFNKAILTKEMERFCQLVNSDQISVYFITNLEEIKGLDAKKQQVLYRIFQELIQNTLKHADAKEVTVQFLKRENKWTLSIEDDGRGFDTSTQKLIALEHRIKSIKAQLTVDSAIDSGTTIFVEV